jgi:UDP-N-acetylmuramyl tripeptide synthase
VRYRLALTTTRAVNATSRRLGRGQGTVAGGRAGLKVDPQLLRRLTAGRRVALISGTNGKTTTTRLLAVALGAHGDDVVSNETGSNMPPGHVAALVANRRAKRAVLEVDEISLPRVLAATGADMVLLLNLSRDQLDRTNEVRMVANRWRAALAAAPHTAVIANADDPLVVWAAGAAAKVSWVGAGLSWHLDAAGCPSCEGRITFADDGAGEWHCESGCGFARPPVTATLLLTDHGSTHHGVWADGRSYEIDLNLPGRFNRANALMVAVAAETVGIDAADALAAMGQIEEVAGRFATRVLGVVPTRLMLAKNPAGWSELLDLVAQDRGPLVVSINARTADGADPSWLWDVPFERLAGRAVVATGDRCADLSVRLHYADVAHLVESDPLTAVHTAATMGDDATPVDATPVDTTPVDVTTVDVIGNYTAFGELLGARP